MEATTNKIYDTILQIQALKGKRDELKSAFLKADIESEKRDILLRIVNIDDEARRVTFETLNIIVGKEAEIKKNSELMHESILTLQKVFVSYSLEAAGAVSQKIN
jgi:hypothetical protein